MGKWDDIDERQKTFGKRLKQALAETQTKQKALAKYVTRSEPLVSLWVNGNALPGTGDLVTICESLGVSADWLLAIDISSKGTYEANGIKWHEQIPNHLTQGYRQEIQDGMELFHLSVNEGLTLAEIQERKGQLN